MSVDGESTLSSAIVSDLTDNRITIAGTDGALEDDANLTFDGTDFQVGGTNFSVAQASGNTTIGGTLDVLGLASLDGGINTDDAFIVADTTGNVSTTGTLTVTGETNLNGGLVMDTDKFIVADGTGNTTIAGTLGVTGQITGDVTGDLTGDVLAGDGTSVLDSGTDGTDATFTGDVTGQVDDISNHSISGLSDVNSNPSAAQAGYLLTWSGSAWAGAAAPEDGVLSLSSSNGIIDNGTAGAPSIELDYEIVSSAPTGVGGTDTGHLWFVV